MRPLNIVLAMLLLLFLLHVQLYEASRPLHAEEDVRLQSLQRGNVPPSGASGCTYIPGTGGPGCPVKEMHYAGDALPRPAMASSFPRLVVLFGVAAANTKEKY
jgi:hypothetical protein